MSLLLQNPALLALLALAGAPLLVHLISRAKPPEYRFSDITFLRKILTTTARFKKPKDHLLLLLRTLALLALAAAFLLPLLLSENTPLPGEKRTLILIIDRSASMAARQGAATRFDAATALATEALSSSRPDLANLIWITATPTATFPQPAPNTDFLLAELTRATPTPQPGAIDAAIELALRQLSDAPGHREIHIISDFQESAWKNFSPSIPENITLTLSKTAQENLPNLAITSLVTIPPAPVAGQQIILQARVENFSPEPRRLSLTLDAGGSRQSQPLDLPANGEAEAIFSLQAPSPGLLPIIAEIDADTFPGDDRRHTAIRIRESLRLAITTPQSHPTTATLAKVAAAIPWLEIIPSADPTRLPPCEILCLPDWNGLTPSPDQLREIAKTTALLILPSTAWSDAQIARLLGTEGGLESPLLQTDPKGWEALPTTTHPAFALFAGGQFGNPLAGRFRSRPKLTELPATTTIATFSDGAPALILDKKLPILVSALSLDPATATWPTESSFLPAIAEILLHLAPSHSRETFSALPGDTLAWENPTPDTSTAPLLEDPSGKALPLTSSGNTSQSETPATPGIYRWLISRQPVHLTAVNFPESESDLTPLAQAPTPSPEKATSTSQRAPTLARGLPLWPHLIAAALILLIAEALLARHNVKTP